MTPPADLRAAFEIINAGRLSIGRPPFLWHDQLYKSAQELADWSWKAYTTGGNPTADPHHDFLERFKRAGWLYQEADGRLKPHPPDARAGTGNFSECGSIGTRDPRVTWKPDPSGWSYPPKAPEEAAKQVVWTLTKSDLARDKNEGHVWDFRAGWTHAGVGHQGGMFVVDYGWLPSTGLPLPPLPDRPVKPDTRLPDWLVWLKKRLRL